MTTALENAFPNPATSPWGYERARTNLAEMFPGVFRSASEAAAADFTIQPFNVIAVAGNDGALAFFSYDDADTTTPDDGGVSTIVVSGRVYKRSGELRLPLAVLSATTSVPPGSPSFGDAYIVPDAPSGAWAANAADIAIWSAAGWIFLEPEPGRQMLALDTGTIWYHDAAGDWQSGIPFPIIADGAVLPLKLAEPFMILKVAEERTAPPAGTPADGTCYQVGAAPTGGFAGHAFEIARYNAALGSYEFLAPDEGDMVYRVDQALNYTYRSGAWVPTERQSGIGQVKVLAGTDEVFSSVAGSPVYGAAVSLTSDPSRRLRFTVHRAAAGISGGVSGAPEFTFGVYKDTDSAPLTLLNEGGSADLGGVAGLSETPVEVVSGGAVLQFIHQPVDTDPHDYCVGVKRSSVSGSANVEANYYILIEEIVFS